MVQTRIDTDKSFISLNYNTETKQLTGDKRFYVTLQDIGDETVDNLEINLNSDEALRIIPNSFTATLGEPQLIVVRLADIETLPEGNFNFKISIENEYAQDKNVNTNIHSSNKNTLTDDVYKLKYFIQRQNYICRFFELVSPSTTLIPIEINGTCQLDRQEKKDLVDPIIASTLSIKLEASIERDLYEINASDEKTFKVEMEYLGNIVFSGFVLPDNSWRSWVADKWTIDVKAICGLSTLKSIAFAQKNSTGNNLVNFFGRMTAIDIINNCLEKTGLKLPIYVNCQLAYNGWIGYNILSSIYLSVERYFQNEDEPLDCDSILRSIMQMFGLCIVQEKNAWYIWRPKDMTNINPLISENQSLFFSVFNGSVYQQNILLTFGDRIGSQINNANKFHCSENQMVRDTSAISAYQISYEFGNSKNILANGGLILEGATGINIPGWTVNTSPDGLVDRGVRVGFGYGLRSAVRPLDPLPKLIELNQSISVTTGIRVVLRIKYRNDGQNSLYLNFKFGVKSPSGNVWYKLSDGSWGGSIGPINRVDNYYQIVQGGNAINYGNGDAIFEMETIIPSDGDAIIEIFRNGHGPGGLFGVHSIELFPSSQGNIKSKDYIARKNNAKSTTLKPTLTVYNGDSESDLFVGTIFKSDSDTPTDLWSRYYINESNEVVFFGDNKELLEIISAEGLFISPRPMTEFEGDFKGYIDYVNFFNIDGFKKPYYLGGIVDKLFQFLKWSYDFDQDVTKMFAREIEEKNMNEDEYNVKIYENFGNETKVTIVS